MLLTLSRNLQIKTFPMMIEISSEIKERGRGKINTIEKRLFLLTTWKYFYIAAHNHRFFILNVFTSPFSTKLLDKIFLRRGK